MTTIRTNSDTEKAKQWLDAQPDLIDCKACKLKITQRACEKYQATWMHDMNFHSYEQGKQGQRLYRHPRFSRCVGSNCPLYEFQATEIERGSTAKATGRRA